MNRRVALFSIPTSAAMCLLPSSLLAEHAALPGWTTDPDQAWKTAQESQRPLLLFISTDNCVYCRKMERDTLSNRRVAAGIQGQFIAASVDATKHLELVRKLKVQSYPTTVIIQPSVGVIDYIKGYIAPRQFLAHLDTAVRRVAGGRQTRRR